LVIVALYFWSGTQKLNWSFGHEVVPDLLAAGGIQLSPAHLLYLPAASVGIALCEVLLGVGLLIRRTRQLAVVAALAMHLLLLALLIAAASNSVVWAWNLGMMAMVVLLFWRADCSLFSAELWRWRGFDLAPQVVKIVLVLCGLLPALGFVGWWDMYLSAALYSGNTPIGVVRVDERVRNQLPARAQLQVFATSRDELMLPFYEWSMAELNVPPYPETRVYRQLARQLCTLEQGPRQIELIVKERPAILNGSYSVSRANCPDLSLR